MNIITAHVVDVTQCSVHYLMHCTVVVQMTTVRITSLWIFLETLFKKLELLEFPCWHYVILSGLRLLTVHIAAVVGMS